MVGKGRAIAVVKPGTLDEALRVLKACVAADTAIIPQGAKTGLTGGSVPRGSGCDRPSVVINMRRLEKILPIGAGQQVLCFAGAGIFSLQEALKPLKRDSHSVLGSIFLNPSVAAGIAFGSGGTQVHKGPAYTDRALFCRITEGGEVELVNTLGLKTPTGQEIIPFLDGATELSASDADPACQRAASWPNYPEHVTSCDGKVSRYCSDLAGEDCNRSEGKVLILATIHDTFPLPRENKFVWISCKDFATANLLKRKVALSSPDCLPKQFEYLGRAQFDCCDRGGRVLIKLIELLGMMNLSGLWNFKLKFEALPIPFVNVLADKVLWYLNPVFPESLPKQLMQQGRDYNHHLIMEMTEFGGGELKRLEALLESVLADLPEGQAKSYVCKDAFESSRVMLFRFAVQPSIRTMAVGTGRQGLIIDYAMPKNFDRILELPEDWGIEMRCLCSHFGCNVFHESLVLRNDVDAEAMKKKIKKFIESSGGKLPAEHGHGTEYAAPEDTQQRWRRIDPRNCMNPGVGQTSCLRHYG
ncbi:dld [Symbiodinium pilosum]|uniref:Dld protein n=1 Tax=Symbiodinium pilosum TaxID=2952 RepID=A0A812W254_SYMPI|nr:dld [Symbiodinium pilosum]